MQKAVVLKDRKRLKQFIYSIFDNERTKLANLTYIFCDDEYLLNINRQFLGHDYYTDIITFDLTGKEGNGKEAEIYISTDRIKENAIMHNTGLKEELLRVIFHGILHICGYGDKKRHEKKIMSAREDYYLKKYKKMH